MGFPENPRANSHALVQLGEKKILKSMGTYGHTTHQTAFSIGYWHRVDSLFTVPPGYAGDPGSDRGPAKALGLTMPGTVGTVAIGAAWIIPGPGGAGNAPGDPTGRP